MPFVEINIADLEFHERLGSGSSGSVYRGFWKSNEKEVAIKKLLLLENEVNTALILINTHHTNHQ